jgi:hypothetical protein
MKEVERNSKKEKQGKSKNAGEGGEIRICGRKETKKKKKKCMGKKKKRAG